jgi:hypothetical protein
VVRIGARRLQILPGPGGRSYAQLPVEVHEQLDSTLAVWYQGRRLAATSLTPPPQGPIRAHHYRRVSPNGPETSRRGETGVSAATSKTRPGGAPRQLSTTPAPQSIQKRSWRPAADYPWRREKREAARRKELRKAGVTFSRNS